MEMYIKNNAIDITYPPKNCGGLIRTYNLLTLCVRKLCAH